MQAALRCICFVLSDALCCRTVSTLGTDSQPEYFEDDMWWIVALSTCRDVLDEGWLDFSVRGQYCVVASVCACVRVGVGFRRFF